jgi:hypothetical protein
MKTYYIINKMDFFYIELRINVLKGLKNIKVLMSLGSKNKGEPGCLPFSIGSESCPTTSNRS